VLASPRVSGETDDDWDAALERNGGHFLQSRAWQAAQRALGYEVVHSRGDSWLWAGSIRAGRFPRYVYVPYGPSGEFGDEALSSIVEVCSSHSLDFARVEPLGQPASTVLDRARAVRAKPVQPRWTWLLDLTAAEDELRHGLSAGHRGSINAAPRRGLRVRRSAEPAEVDVLCELQRRAAGRGRYRGHSPAYFHALASSLMPRGAAALYFAEVDGDALASALVFDFARTRYYAHAASDPDRGRRLGAAAPLVWQMILDARAAGASAFDFWGVAPPAARDHGWAGFSQFKRAFGGRLVERPGAWEIPQRVSRHRLFRVLRTFSR